MWGEYVGNILILCCQYIQNSFVEERKAATENKTELPTQEELMHRMNLARLAAASFGESHLTQERYDYVVELDKKRKSRIAPASSSSAPQPNK